MIKKPTLLRIAAQGNPVLQQVACRVSDSQSEEIKDLITNMLATCAETGAQGLAAPQVYRSIRLMVVVSKPSLAYPKAPKIKPFAIINPRVIKYSIASVLGWEGCMSIRGIRAMVRRSQWVGVEYTDGAGNQVTVRLEGFIARIFQHEFDHLEGKSFLERADPRSIMVEEEFMKMIKWQGRALRSVNLK